jgi:small subunit ribosomal protein S16
MVKIRLRRVGGKHKPIYRLIATDHRAPRDGAFIEVIGNYNPLTDPETVKVDEEKAIKWLESGAQPTQTAYKLLVKTGVMGKFQSAHPERKFKQAIQKTTQKKKKKKSKSSAEVSSS